MIEKRIFVVGCPRSGTTLVQACLSRHPLVASFPETHFFARLQPRRRWLARLLSRRLLARRALFLAGEALERPRLAASVAPAWWDPAWEKGLLRLLDGVAEQLGCIAWIEKTPRHLHQIREIEARIPGSHFVHVVRDGAPTISSLYKATTQHPEKWGGRRSLEECVDRWNADIQRTRACLGQPRHVAVRYEELVAHSERELRRLCSFLDLPFASALLEPEHSYAAIVREDEPWKQHNASGFRSCPSRSFLTPEQEAWVRARLVPAPDRATPTSSTSR